MPLSVFRAWSVEDRVAALGLTEYEDGKCSGCGHQISESMDPATERRWVPTEPIRCHACTARDKMAESYQDQVGAQALRFPVVLMPPRATPGT